MSTPSTPESVTVEPIAEDAPVVSPLRRRALVALALALLAAVVTRVLAVATVGSAADSFDPLTLAPLVVVSAVAAVGATAVYAVIRRFTERPDRVFAVVAAVVLVASFSPLLVAAPEIPGATLGGSVLLGLAHVLVAVGIVGGLTGRLG